jgi:hypothetical protein
MALCKIRSRVTIGKPSGEPILAATKFAVMPGKNALTTADAKKVDERFQ